MAAILNDWLFFSRRRERCIESVSLFGGTSVVYDDGRRVVEAGREKKDTEGGEANANRCAIAESPNLQELREGKSANVGKSAISYPANRNAFIRSLSQYIVHSRESPTGGLLVA